MELAQLSKELLGVISAVLVFYGLNELSFNYHGEVKGLLGAGIVLHNKVVDNVDEVQLVV